MLDFGYYNMDCMAGMREFPDKFFDLAIVDPPYEQGFDGYDCKRKSTKKWKNPITKVYSKKYWDKKPSKDYFDELFRVSKNQVIWGANHFSIYLPFSSGWIFWDKQNEVTTYSDGELAYTSFDKGIKKFSWMWSGFYKHRPEIRIHPTQKPVALYRWLLQNYAQPGDKLISTHVGSASDLIAFEMEGFTEYIGFEIDADYYQDSVKRLETWRKSRTIDIFQPQELRQIEQSKLTFNW